MQRLSCALARAVAWELATAMELTRGEYEATTWAARTWTSFACQRVSVALYRAVAREIAQALGLSRAADTRVSDALQARR